MGLCSICASSSTPRCLQPIAEFLSGWFWSLQMPWRSALGSGRGMSSPPWHTEHYMWVSPASPCAYPVLAMPYPSRSHEAGAD